MLSTITKMSVAELQAKVDDYFNKCEEKNIIPLYTELAAHLGTNRMDMNRYYRGESQQSDKKWYKDRQKIIHQSRDRCEAGIARELLKGHGQVSGPIFILKNNYGWSDRYEVDNPTGGNTINITFKQKGNGKAKDKKGKRNPALDRS